MSGTRIGTASLSSVVVIARKCDVISHFDCRDEPPRSRQLGMDNSTILQRRIAGFFSEKLHLDVTVFDADIVETGLLDSLALVELILFLEQEFRIEVPLDEIDYFRSIDSIADLIAGRVAVRA